MNEIPKIKEVLTTLCSLPGVSGYETTISDAPVVQNKIKRGKAAKEPLFHITKRAEMVWWKSWGIHIIAVLLALIVCAFIIVLMTGSGGYA